MKALGRHARTIRFGRSLWESPTLDANAANLIRERFFDDGTFPPMTDVKTYVTLAQNPVEERPAPIQGQTLSSAALTTLAYGQCISAWLDRVKQEYEVPTSEQRAVLA